MNSVLVLSLMGKTKKESFLEKSEHLEFCQRNLSTSMPFLLTKCVDMQDSLESVNAGA